MKDNMDKYLEHKNKRINKMVSNINKSQIRIQDLDNESLDELISYYNTQISFKKKYLKSLRKKIQIRREIK